MLETASEVRFSSNTTLNQILINMLLIEHYYAQKQKVANVYRNSWFRLSIRIRIPTSFIFLFDICGQHWIVLCWWFWWDFPHRKLLLMGALLGCVLIKDSVEEKEQVNRSNGSDLIIFPCFSFPSLNPWLKYSLYQNYRIPHHSQVSLGTWRSQSVLVLKKKVFGTFSGRETKGRKNAL